MGRGGARNVEKEAERINIQITLWWWWCVFLFVFWLRQRGMYPGKMSLVPSVGSLTVNKHCVTLCGKTPLPSPCHCVHSYTVSDFKLSLDFVW